MGLFHRSGGYTIFIPEIDAEHRTMFRLVDELATALDSGTPRARNEALQSIVSQMQLHFAHEERLMRASAYSALVWHKQQHDGSRRQVKRFVKRIEQGDRGFLLCNVEAGGRAGCPLERQSAKDFLSVGQILLRHLDAVA